MPKALIAGAAAADVTPDQGAFLFGYPHVPRAATGVHDRLTSTALFLSDGRTPLVVVANDVIYVGKDLVARARERIAWRCGLAPENVMVTATHTHSGPVTVELLVSQADPVVPPADPQYLRKLEDGIVEAGAGAVRGSRPAELGLVIADGSCVGGNRHDPSGPSDPEVPVLLARQRAGGAFLWAMVVCNVHPTVLHEDSTLVSGDFPAATRRYLQAHLLGEGCPVVYHTGPSGNQSPRHVARANTVEEATRLGDLLGGEIVRQGGAVAWHRAAALGCVRTMVSMPPRTMRRPEEAEAALRRARQRLAALRDAGAPKGEVRTAECDWFGAEEALVLARAAAEGRLAAAVEAVMPAEIMALRIGPWTFVGWPGECYAEFGLEVKSRRSGCYPISLAGGELQGYIVTEEARQRGWYEAGNALFDGPRSGQLLVDATLQLVDRLDADTAVAGG